MGHTCRVMRLPGEAGVDSLRSHITTSCDPAALGEDAMGVVWVPWGPCPGCWHLCRQTVLHPLPCQCARPVCGTLCPPRPYSVPFPRWPAVHRLPGTEIGPDSRGLAGAWRSHHADHPSRRAGLYALSYSSRSARLGDQSFCPLLSILRDEPEVLAGSLLGKGSAVTSKALLAGDTLRACGVLRVPPGDGAVPPRIPAAQGWGMAGPGQGGPGRAGGGRMSAP